MSQVAAKAVVSASAPGQFDAVAETLGKLGASSGKWLTEAQLELQEFQCKSLQTSLDHHPMAKALHEKLQDYQKENLKQGMTTRVALTQGPSKELVVHTYAEKIDATNQHAGSWKATWTVDKLTSTQGQISGSVIVQSYAHEEGNVQLKIVKEFPAVTVTDEASLADGLIQQIQSWETILLGILATMNEDVSAEHLRSIRRVLPITKTKMNWDAIAHRSVKTLKQSAPETRSKVKYNN